MRPAYPGAGRLAEIVARRPRHSEAREPGPPRAAQRHASISAVACARQDCQQRARDGQEMDLSADSDTEKKTSARTYLVWAAVILAICVAAELLGEFVAPAIGMALFGLLALVLMVYPIRDFYKYQRYDAKLEFERRYTIYRDPRDPEPIYTPSPPHCHVSRPLRLRRVLRRVFTILVTGVRRIQWIWLD